MYQDKIESEAKKLIEEQKSRYIHPNVFMRESLNPLEFSPDEEGDDATHIARDILSKRTNEDILLISKSIDSILQVGEELLKTLSIRMLSTSPSRKAITLTQGRSLYILCDYFDLTTIPVKKVQWCEMFATLALMQVAEIYSSKHANYGDDEVAQAMKINSEPFVLDMAQETLDSIARAECLFDKKQKSVITGGKGGLSKGVRIKPLKDEVIRLYVESHTNRSNRHAAKLIEAELTKSGSPLLTLSSSDEKQVEFGKWIGKFKNKEIQLPVDM